MLFHWSLGYSILADLSNTVVSMVFTRYLISKSSSHCTNLLMTVPRARFTISFTVNFMSHSFLNSLVMSRHVSFFSLSFNFTLWSAGTAKSTVQQVLFCSFFFFFFFVDYARSDPLAKITWSVCISKYQRSLCLILQNRILVCACTTSSYG